MIADATQLNVAHDPTSNPLDYISASRLKCFQECGLKFKFRYVDKIPSATSPALFIGTVTHAVLEQWNQTRWRIDPTDISLMKRLFNQLWVNQPDDINWKDKEVAARIKTWDMLKHYFEETPIPEEEIPEGVEAFLESDLPGLPPLRGVIDLVREGGKIVDFKTAACTPSSPMVEHQNEIQLGCYSLLFREATGQEESGFELHHLVKTKQPKLVITTIAPMNPDQIRTLLAQMESYVQGVQAEDYVPSPGQHCSWCDYFNQCQAWKGGAS